MSGLRTGMARIVGVIAPVAVVAACTSGSATHGPPRGVTGCNHMFSMGDAGTGMGLDWDGDSHPYGRSVFLYVCDGRAATVTVEAPPHVSVTPTTARVDTAALLQLSVIVERGALGAIHFEFRDSTGAPFGDVRGPEIVAGKDSWHFADHT